MRLRTVQFWILHKITQEHIFSKVTGEEVTIDPTQNPYLENKSVEEEAKKYRQHHTKSFVEECKARSEVEGRTRRETATLTAQKLAF